MLISGPFWLYIFTALSRTAHGGDRRAIQELARGALRLGSATLAPLFCGLALVADLIVAVILGPKWTGAIGPLRVLPAAGFGFSMCLIIASTLMGLGRSALQLRLALAMGLTTIVTVGGAASFGVVAVSGALACGVWAVGFYYVDQLARDLKTSRASLLLALAPALLGCLALTSTVLLVREALRAAPPGAVLVAAIASGAAAYGATLWLFARKSLAEDALAFSRAQGDTRTPDDAAASHFEAEALNSMG
jgi:PST family polysaccharide transporter